MRRRTFLWFVLGGAAAVVAPVLSLLGRLAPEPCVRAVRARLYPGPVKELAGEDIERPGRWAG